jgi:hypothetical protein
LLLSFEAPEKRTISGRDYGFLEFALMRRFGHAGECFTPERNRRQLAGDMERQRKTALE